AQFENQTNAPEREQDAECSPDEREQQILRQELLPETHTSGSERSAHCKLFLSRGHLRQEQIRNVCARYEQQEADCREDNEQRLSRVADQIFLQWNEGKVGCVRSGAVLL